MKITIEQEERLIELENKNELNLVESIELQALLDYYYDTGECENNKRLVITDRGRIRKIE